MSCPGCASNVQLPAAAVANCVKSFPLLSLERKKTLRHWKQNYSSLFEALHICCRNRRGADYELTAHVRAAVNLRERPAPGLDAHHRLKRKSLKGKRLKININYSDDAHTHIYICIYIVDFR